MNYTIDLQEIADKLDFDLEDIEMLIEVFLEDARESLDVLENAVKTNDIEEIFKSAHSIKGSAANLTLNEISELAREIELNAKENNTYNYEESYKKLKFLTEALLEQ